MRADEEAEVPVLQRCTASTCTSGCAVYLSTPRFIPACSTAMPSCSTCRALPSSLYPPLSSSQPWSTSDIAARHCPLLLAAVSTLKRLTLKHCRQLEASSMLMLTDAANGRDDDEDDEYDVPVRPTLCDTWCGSVPNRSKYALLGATQQGSTYSPPACTVLPPGCCFTRSPPTSAAYPAFFSVSLCLPKPESQISPVFAPYRLPYCTVLCVQCLQSL
jgi:hypothetical protein